MARALTLKDSAVVCIRVEYNPKDYNDDHALMDAMEAEFCRLIDAHKPGVFIGFSRANHRVDKAEAYTNTGKAANEWIQCDVRLAFYAAFPIPGPDEVWTCPEEMRRKD